MAKAKQTVKTTKITKTTKAITHKQKRCPNCGKFMK